MSMKIALLGAGHIGQTIATWLSASGDFQITAFDQHEDSLRRLAEQAQAPAGALRTAVLQADDLARAAGVLRGHDAVINALPYHLATRAATAAREAGCHYFDLTEDVAATKAIKQLAEGARTAFMPQCGLAPGFIGIVAHHLAQGFEAVHRPSPPTPSSTTSPGAWTG
jgi:saccharopine dehydrogenase-like NADP-dependent oxidoreductase